MASDIRRPAKDRGFRIQGLGFKVQGLGFWVEGLGFRIQDFYTSLGFAELWFMLSGSRGFG